MTDPIIGLTTHGLNEKGSYHTPATYASCIRNGGGIPVLIPPGEKRLAELVETLDGFVFTGGGDIDPGLYGGEVDESVYGVDETRDTMELRLARLIIEQRVPTLAICRGLQVFTVAMGGTLKKDIVPELNGKVIHRLPEFKPSLHSVSISSASRLAAMLKKLDISCASVHHQAVDQLPDNATVSALAADGIIEAVEFDGHDHLIAVQWHPEITAENDPDQQHLFDGLIAKATEYKLKRRKSCV